MFPYMHVHASSTCECSLIKGWAQNLLLLCLGLAAVGEVVTSVLSTQNCDCIFSRDLDPIEL